MTSLPDILNLRLHQRDINRLVATADMEAVYAEIFSENQRVAYNALWVLTHMPPRFNLWLSEKRNEMIDMLLSETHIGKKRLLMNLLNRLTTEPHDIRTDYLDFCLRKINSEEPYAIRSFAIKQAYEQAKHYPELLTELREELELMSTQPLPPGLQCTLRHIGSKVGID